jgi:hypothetical protein
MLEYIEKLTVMHAVISPVTGSTVISIHHREIVYFMGW